MTPRELAELLKTGKINPDQLNSLAHALLYQAREYAPDQKSQDALAKKEHRAFAREAISENLGLALPIALAAPAYQAYKVSGLSDSRSRPSLGQLGQGLIGVGEGIKENMTNRGNRLSELLKQYGFGLPTPKADPFATRSRTAGTGTATSAIGPS